MGQKYWILKTTEGGPGFLDHWEDFKFEKVIGIGFESGIRGDPSKFSSPDELLRHQTKRNRHSTSFAASSLIKFAKEIQDGDWLIITTGYVPNQEKQVILYGFARAGKYKYDRRSTWWTRKRSAEIFPIEKSVPIHSYSRVFGGSLRQTLHGPYPREKIIEFLRRIPAGIKVGRHAQKAFHALLQSLQVTRISSEAPFIWWINANKRWHWDRFFRQNTYSTPWEYGGAKWIGSSSSFSRIKTMRKGDVVLAYQAGEGILGLARLASKGYPSGTDGKFNNFKVSPSPKVRLNIPVPLSLISNLPNAVKNIGFIGGVKRGTVFDVNSDGFQNILELMLELNPDQRKEISAFFPALYSPPSEIPRLSFSSVSLRKTHRENIEQNRIIRDSAVGRQMKISYGYKCQICGALIHLPNRKQYAEVHHLRPLGRPHNGKDGPGNIIVVCPLHHALFDLHAMVIHPATLKIEYWDRKINDHGSSLFLQPGHVLDGACLRYHYRLFRKAIR